MTRGARTAVTIAVLCVLLAVAAVWGWHATTKPLPGKVDSPICVDTSVAAGDKVFPEQVTVSVYNAGDREGLAGRTMQLLTDAGFAEGKSGNAPDGKVSDVAIWTQEPDNPAVLLVASRLGPDVDIVDKPGQGAGVTVVVGDDFTDLVKGRRAITAAADSQICSPPVD
ncbi:LytR C-terminal domain-containing protein [Nocardioides sp. CN2-186]|uniref:LytR C-terminal domain-containing protein n=1 Tax=Nocardioides tweenelious TaxID=3156607 RepID=UPI0032B50077